MKNFGVYQPPSGIENVRRSTQINSINNLNNPRRRFDEMIEQGWGGNIPGGSPAPTPSPSPSPSPSSSLLPPGNLSPDQIDAAMQTTNCTSVSITLVNFWGAGGGEGPSESYSGDREGVVFRSRPVLDPDTGLRTNQFITSWDSEYVFTVWADEIYSSLSDWFQNFYDYGLGTNWDYFDVDPVTRTRCFSPSLPPPPSPSLGGNASPPPPGKNMCGCDCNTIATIVEDKIAGRDKLIKDHIDQRTIEELKAVNKMLQGMKIDLNLQPIIDRLNQVEANLWNGAGG